MKYIFWLCIFFPVAAFPQADFSHAEKLFRSGKYPQAQIAFGQYLESHPNHLQSIEYLGDIRGMAKDWKQAMYYYQKLQKLKPFEANYHYKYGGALGMYAKDCNKLRALGLIGDIRNSFEKAIQLNPKHIEARWALIELYLQLPGIAGGSEKKAVQYSDELLRLSPVDGYLAKGRISEYFEHFAKAENYYKKAIEIGSSKTTYQKLADLYKNKMNQPERAKLVMENYQKLQAKG